METISQVEVSAKDSIIGKEYLSKGGSFDKAKYPILVWRKRLVKGEISRVYVFLPSIDKVVDVSPDYRLEESPNRTNIEGPNLVEFDRKVLSRFQRDYPNKISIWNTEEKKSKPQKEEVKMTDQETVTTSAPSTGKERKALRADLNSQIAKLKNDRKTLSNSNIDLKKKIETTEDKTERKNFSAQIKENVAQRATMSEQIKNLVSQIKAIRAA